MEKEKEKREQSENNEGKNCDKDLKERRKKKTFIPEPDAILSN